MAERGIAFLLLTTPITIICNSILYILVYSMHLRLDVRPCGTVDLQFRPGKTPTQSTTILISGTKVSVEVEGKSRFTSADDSFTEPESDEIDAVPAESDSKRVLRKSGNSQLLKK